MSAKKFEVIESLLLNGREFVISFAIRPCGKTGYYADELGDYTQWGKLFKTGERKAHCLNPSMRVKGYKWIRKPFNTWREARMAAAERSTTTVIYS